MMLRLRACFLLGCIVTPIGYSAPLHEPDLTLSKKPIAAVDKLSIIADLAKKPRTRNIDQLARNLRFSYRIGDCNKTDQFQTFCEYQVIEQEPVLGKILILALGEDKTSGTSGGRIVWAAGKDNNCISKETASTFFGTGTYRSQSMPEPIPGQSIPSNTTENSELIYRSIPNSESSAVAVVSFRNNCVNQIFLDF